LKAGSSGLETSFRHSLFDPDQVDFEVLARKRPGIGKAA
jgi:hypothetical protein